MPLWQIIAILILVQLLVILLAKLVGQKVANAASIPLEGVMQRIDRAYVGKAGVEWDRQVKEMLERSASELKDVYEKTLDHFGIKATVMQVPPVAGLPESMKDFFTRFERLSFAEGYTPVDVQGLSEREDRDSRKVIVFGADPENQSDQYAVMKGGDDTIYILSEEGDLEKFVPSFEHLVLFHAKLMEHTRILLQPPSKNSTRP